MGLLLLTFEVGPGQQVESKLRTWQVNEKMKVDIC